MSDAHRKKFEYDEQSYSLDQRISAHRQYSNFDLHEWIHSNFSLCSGESVFDLGCGNGNFTSLFWRAVEPNGYVLGCDKNRALVGQAIERHEALPSERVRFFVDDFDEILPGNDLFDWIFSIYSIYYSKNSLILVNTLLERLKPEGTLVIIGPGPNNIHELTEFGKYLTGREPRPEHQERMKRISKEFQPILKERLGDSRVDYLEINSTMSFPDAESFANYYWSTLNWRESLEGFDAETIEELKEKTLIWANKNPDVRVVRKQMSCLSGQKK